MRTTTIAHLPAALLLLAACKPDCPEGVTDHHGYRCTPIPTATSEPETTTADSTGTTAEPDTTTADTSSTTEPLPCDDDPACGPGETPETCPEQCSACGDGLQSAAELCDNGTANKTYWPTQPPDGACSKTCDFSFQWCGDATLTAKEQCDNGTNTDPPYSPTLPDNACAPGCILPGYCGDGEHTGEEACDDGQQTATCELDCSPPVCGDSTHNPLAGEACDDGNNNDGDGCSADCNSIERFVFVTSTAYKGHLNKTANDDLEGLPLADLRCQTLAMNAGLIGNFKAWLSTSDESPSTRFDTRFTGLYRLRSAGAPIVAMGWDGLVSGTLLHPIDSDETGAATQENVWTNTLPDGTSASELDCAGWSANDNKTSTIGISSATDATWTTLGGGQFCSGSNRLYCFQDL